MFPLFLWTDNKPNNQPRPERKTKMNHNNAIRVLYGQDGRMLRVSTIDNPNTPNENNAPKHYRFELDGDFDVVETWTPGQRNVVLEAVL